MDIFEEVLCAIFMGTKWQTALISTDIKVQILTFQIKNKAVCVLLQGLHPCVLDESGENEISNYIKE